MVLLKNALFKRIVLISFIAIMLTFFCLTPVANASKIQMGEDEFYYAGVTKGEYRPAESAISWLLNKIGEIADYLLGLFTMGGRMVFIGWTALFEILLTQMLESSTGIPMDLEKIDATSVENNTSSTENITVEAIVYNQVPILNINLFKDTLLCTNGTGHFIECDECGEGVLTKRCKMVNCECEKCAETMAAAGQTGENAVSLIKENVSMWYYIMRLIAMAAMLCVLIGIGIKMAISSAAQEKALYKRMIVDWLVGMILLFSIHYIMIAIVDLNESLVGIVQDIQTEVDSKIRKEFRLPKKDNKELEISVYEAVRTRAYDPKLINGMTGTVMYITLVFMAVRFTFMYLKRYLTIIVLTLLAPGAAFSFAIQKALTGKSKAFSNWLREYFMNVIIQTVHAIVYTSFVTIALDISLDSISGMIIAFVFMNFMLKADDLFRKIFKMSEGGSLADDTINNSDPKKLMQSAKSAIGIVTATKFMNKSPITKAVRAPLKMAGTGTVLGIAKLKDKFSKEGDSIQKALDKNDNLENSLKNIKALRQELNKLTGKESSANKDFKKYVEEIYKKDKGIGFDGEDAMDKELLDLEKEAKVLNDKKDLSEKESEILERIQQERQKFDDATNVTTKDVIKAHIDKFFDINNYYETDVTKNADYQPTRDQIKDERVRKGFFIKGLDEDTNDKLAMESLKKRRQYRRKNKFTILPKYDRTQNKWTRKTMSNLVAEQLKSENLLGLTQADKKLMKESVGMVKDTLVGFGSLFVGLGTIVTNPGAGIGLLATGSNASFNVMDKLGVFDTNKHLAPVVSEKNKKYSFNRFEKGARQTIVKAIMAKSEGEKDKLVVANVRKNHENLYKTLKIGGAGLAVLGTLTVAKAPIAIGAATFVVANKAVKYSGYSQNSLIGRINKQHFKQLKEQKEKLIQDEIFISTEEEKRDFTKSYEELVLLLNAEVDELPKKTKEEVNSLHEQRKESEEKAISTGDAVKTKKGETVILREPKIKQEAQLIEESTAEVIIQKMTTNRVSFEIVNSEAVQDEIAKVIEQKLITQGTLAKGQKVDESIKDIKKKIKISATQIIQEEIGIVFDSEIDNPKEKSKKDDEKQITVFEEVMIQQVIKEQLEKGTGDIVGELRADKIVKEVLHKKQNISESKDVVDDLFKKKKEINPDYLTKPEEETSLNTQYKKELSQPSIDFIQKTVAQIRAANKPIIAPITEEDRRKEKLRRIKALDRILTDSANEQLTPTILDESEQPSFEEQLHKKSTDEIIQELFQNTQQQQAVYDLIDNVDSLKRLNVRAELNKTKGKNKNYFRAKKQSDLQKAYSLHPDFISNADRVYTKGDGSKDLSGQIATYGPVTDVISLIRETSEQKEILIKDTDSKK